MGPGAEDAAPNERRHARVVDRAVRLAEVHGGRPRACRRDEGLHGAGAVPHAVPDRDRRQRARAALRGQRHARAQAVPDGRDADTAGGLRLRADARARAAKARSTRRIGRCVDFNKVVAGEERGGPFVSDDRAFANIIIGNYQRPAPTDKGHFHEEGSEFWLIMLGKVRYKMEGLRRIRGGTGRRGLRAAPDVAPREQRRQPGLTLVPARHERLPVSGAHVGAGLSVADWSSGVPAG